MDWDIFEKVKGIRKRKEKYSKIKHRNPIFFFRLVNVTIPPSHSASGEYNYSASEGAGSSGGVVEGLRPWTRYQLVVRAVNAYGRGPPSGPVVVQTREDGEGRMALMLCSFDIVKK